MREHVGGEGRHIPQLRTVQVASQAVGAPSAWQQRDGSLPSTDGSLCCVAERAPYACEATKSENILKMTLLNRNEMCIKK